jgi:hypothetical protein
VGQGATAIWALVYVFDGVQSQVDDGTAGGASAAGSDAGNQDFRVYHDGNDTRYLHVQVSKDIIQLAGLLAGARVAVK